MITRQYILRKYRISYVTLWHMLRRLPEKDRKKLALKPRQRYLKSNQVETIIELFGDFEERKFELKSELARRYGVSTETFMKWLRDEFPADHPVLNRQLYISPLHQTLIEKKIGKP